MGNEAVKFEKEIHALPSEIEIVGMGQKGGSIFFKVKGKEDLKWIKK